MKNRCGALEWVAGEGDAQRQPEGSGCGLLIGWSLGKEVAKSDEQADASKPNRPPYHFSV